MPNRKSVITVTAPELNKSVKIDLSQDMKDITSSLEKFSNCNIKLDGEVDFTSYKKFIYALRQANMHKTVFKDELTLIDEDRPVYQSELNRIKKRLNVSLNKRRTLKEKIKAHIIKCTPKENSSPGVPTENIAIVGLGPVGLMATLAAIQSHSGKSPYKIIALYDRDPTPTRGQILILDIEQLKYLTKLLGEEVISELKISKQLDSTIVNGRSVNTIKTKTLERILREAVEIAARKNPNLIELKQTKKESEVSFSEDSITIIQANGKPETFSVCSVIAADGGKHSSATAYGNKFNTDFEFSPIQNVGKSELVAANFRIKEEITVDKRKRIKSCIEKGSSSIEKRYLTNKLRYNSELKEKFKNFGWVGESYPEARVFLSKNTLYILVEPPLNPTTDFNEKEWAQMNLELWLPDEDKNIFETKKWGDTEKEKGQKKMQSTRFTVEVEAARKFGIARSNLEGEAKFDFFHIGDSAFKINPLTGYGLQTGMQEVAALEENVFTPMLGSSKKPTLAIATKRVKKVNREIKKSISQSVLRVLSMLKIKKQKSKDYVTQVGFMKDFNKTLTDYQLELGKVERDKNLTPQNRGLEKEKIQLKILSHILQIGGDDRTVGGLSVDIHKFLQNPKLKSDLIDLYLKIFSSPEILNEIDFMSSNHVNFTGNEKDNNEVKLALLKEVFLNINNQRVGNSLFNRTLFTARGMGLNKSGKITSIGKLIQTSNIFSKDEKLNLTKSSKKFIETAKKHPDSTKNEEKLAKAVLGLNEIKLKEIIDYTPELTSLLITRAPNEFSTLFGNNEDVLMLLAENQPHVLITLLEEGKKNDILKQKINEALNGGSTVTKESLISLFNKKQLANDLQEPIETLLDELQQKMPARLPPLL